MKRNFLDVVGAMRDRIQAMANRCNAIGCPEKLRGTLPLFCDRHFRMLPEEMRKHLFNTFPATLDKALEDAQEFIEKIESRGLK